MSDKRSGDGAKTLSFTDGLKYVFVQVAPLFDDQPVVVNQLLTLIATAEKQHAVPAEVEVPTCVGKVAWRREFERQKIQFRRRGGFYPVVAPGDEGKRLPRGRPRRRMESVS